MGLDKFMIIDKEKSFDEKQERLELLTKDFISNGLTEDVALHKAEQEIFKPKVLEDINLQGNITAGKLIGIKFFVDAENFSKINKNFNIIVQMDEYRIAGASTNDFIKKVLGEK